MESASLFGKDGVDVAKGQFGDPTSPKRNGGFWPLVSLLASGILCTAIVSNLWALTEWREIMNMYKGDEYEGDNNNCVCLTIVPAYYKC